MSDKPEPPKWTRAGCIAFGLVLGLFVWGAVIGLGQYTGAVLVMPGAWFQQFDYFKP